MGDGEICVLLSFFLSMTSFALMTLINYVKTDEKRTNLSEKGS